MTTGPIVGWGSSTVKDVAVGNSAVLSATVAPDLALSGSATVPVEGDSLKTLQPHVDPTYGQIPATLYLGGGGGTAYGGAGVGGSHVFASAIANLFPLSGSVIVDP